MLLDLPQNVLHQTLQVLIDCKNVKSVLKLRACCFRSNEIVLDARLKFCGFASDRCLTQRHADVSDDRSSKGYSFIAKSTNWGFKEYKLNFLCNGFLSSPVLEKVFENRRLIKLMLEKIAYSDRIRKLRCCVDDHLGLTGLISCYALKDLCLAEPSVKLFELNASLDELVSLSLNGLILNLRPSSGQLPSLSSLRVLSVDIRKFNDNESPNW